MGEFSFDNVSRLHLNQKGQGWIVSVFAGPRDRSQARKPSWYLRAAMHCSPIATCNPQCCMDASLQHFPTCCLPSVALRRKSKLRIPYSIRTFFGSARLMHPKNWGLRFLLINGTSWSVLNRHSFPPRDRISAPCWECPCLRTCSWVSPSQRIQLTDSTRASWPSDRISY